MACSLMVISSLIFFIVTSSPNRDTKSQMSSICCLAVSSNTCTMSVPLLMIPYPATPSALQARMREGTSEHKHFRITYFRKTISFCEIYLFFLHLMCSRGHPVSAQLRASYQNITSEIRNFTSCIESF